MSEMDDLSRWLEGEWKVGRAEQIAEEMSRMLTTLSAQRTERRVQDLRTEATADPARAAALKKMSAEGAAVLFQAQAMAENVLFVVAAYLAKHEYDPRP